jgi:nucleotidyltransferase/DNA polymerase involved in DNA repair
MKEQFGVDVFEKESEQMFDVIRKYSQNIIIEKTSIDDFFIDLTDICEEYEKLKESHFNRTFFQKWKVVMEGSVRQLMFGNNDSFRGSKWAKAAVVVTDICDQIRGQTGLICSAGISVNKSLAKIVCKYNKPNKISLIFSKPAIARIFEKRPLSDCDRLGKRLRICSKSQLLWNCEESQNVFLKKSSTKRMGFTFGMSVEALISIAFTTSRIKIKR